MHQPSLASVVARHCVADRGDYGGVSGGEVVPGPCPVLRAPRTAAYPVDVERSRRFRAVQSARAVVPRSGVVPLSADLELGVFVMGAREAPSCSIVSPGSAMM